MSLKFDGKGLVFAPFHKQFLGLLRFFIPSKMLIHEIGLLRGKAVARLEGV
jgi:hypothetical protein